MKKINGNIASPKGFKADGIHCGLKRKRKDIGWIISTVPAQCAGVFTTNQVKTAPVLVTKEKLKNKSLQAIIVNSGNANACTGNQGYQDAITMCEKTAEHLNIDAAQVAVASTGIIGKHLQMFQIEAGLELLANNQDCAAENFQEAILTTDTCQKVSAYQEEIDGKTITVAGCAKGSGMIHPNMATMLSFITTDANISSDLLQELLSELTEITFNQITVDGDTSTNDMVLVLANGEAKNAEIQKGSLAYQQFKNVLQAVFTDLAKSIAKDGEGATKLIEVQVENTVDEYSARMLAKSVVGSSLVKSAIFGQDPNWGRILCALGYSGIDFDSNQIEIYLEDTLVFAFGVPTDFSADQLSEKLKQAEITIKVNMHDGVAQGKAWGCDLTYGYVKINALYHT
ncbi:bifunctional glutamate N-acetyltransferase/amino-acid acetyltransferase ArgJ [Enterococcus cecorum]|nr:bifunctional glutamate N-acetyltransferase/amino-acid acetyltransferase ArgJ [Enterococcus cecorum]